MAEVCSFVRPISHGAPTTAIPNTTYTLVSATRWHHHGQLRSARYVHQFYAVRATGAFGRCCRIWSCTQVSDAKNPLSATGRRTTAAQPATTSVQFNAADAGIATSETQPLHAIIPRAGGAVLLLPSAYAASRQFQSEKPPATQSGHD